MFESIKAWFSKHRKAVFVTATVLAITGSFAVLLIKGKKVKIPLKELAGKIVPDVAVSSETVTQAVSVELDGVMKIVPRKEFVRKLHDGWTHSAAKAVEAAAKGYDLKPGETLVNACTVTMKVAS